MTSSQFTSAPPSPASARPAHPKARKRGPAAKPPPAAPAPKTHSAQSAPPNRLRTRFTAPQLLCQFHRLLPVSLLAGWLALSDKVFYQRAFTPLLTLWYCVFQRLSDNHRLSHVVEDALAGGADRLSPRGKPLSRGLFSEATTAFSDARQRVPLDLFRRTLAHTATQTAAAFRTPRWFGLQVGLLDGTTTRLRPLGDIPERFPPHRPGNCKKSPYWCLARIVGILCLATGVVLDSALGPLTASEQALSLSLLLPHPWKSWLLLGDRNFGVYSVAWAAVAAQAHVLLRLTQARATKLARTAGLTLAPGLDVPLRWSPSRHDQVPEGLAHTPVQGRLVAIRIERPGYRSFTLYLFTTLLDPLACPAHQLAQLYAQRWQIELCFRYIKTQMDLGFLECRSANMACKEWLAGLIAYNLIRWTMAAAAALAGVSLSLLSFSRARELLLGWCRRSAPQPYGRKSWERLLARVAKARLPKRRKRRPSEPRAIRPFQKDFAKLLGSRATAREQLAKSNANC
jgi:hypothetical protein